MTNVSFHGGHSGDFCDHARDTKPAMVGEYIRQGFSHVGIVDHMPPPGDSFLYDDEIENGHNAAFLAERFDSYLTSARKQIKDTCGNEIHLLFGFETEFCGQNPVDRIVELAGKYNPDFIVASVHHVNDIPIDYSPEKYREAMETAGGMESLHIQYYDHQFELIQGLSSALNIPMVIGHFDVIKLLSSSYKPSKAVNERILRNVRLAIDRGCIFEVNARAFKKGLGEPYPSVSILEMIANHKGKITLGDDSHSVSEVGHFFPEVLSIIKQYFDEITVFEKENGALSVKAISIF